MVQKGRCTCLVTWGGLRLGVRQVMEVVEDGGVGVHVKARSGSSGECDNGAKQLDG
jgi:hypothetical protein